MTEQDWEIVETGCVKQLFGNSKLKIDGYSITLSKEQIGTFELAIVVYVNGSLNGEWFTKDCEIRRRFFRRSAHYIYPLKLRKHRLFKNDPEYQKQYYNYHFYWKSFTSLKSHLIKNNENIELVRD
jgi:hypothetical protein